MLSRQWTQNEHSPGALPEMQHVRHLSGPAEAPKFLDAGHALAQQQQLQTRAHPPLEAAVPRVPLLGIGQGG